MNPLSRNYRYPYDYDYIMRTDGAQLFMLREALLGNNWRDEDRFEDELEQYDLTREQVREFIERYFPCIPMYDSDKFEEEIKNRLHEMKDQGFDFIYSSDPDLIDLFFGQRNTKKPICRPHCHLKFRCENCPNSIKKKKGRKDQTVYKWTTSKGTIRIRYKVMHLKDFNSRVNPEQRIKKTWIKSLKTPYMVLFDVKIYSMKCTGPCKDYGSVKIYEPWVGYYCSVLCLRVCEKITGVRYLNEGKKPKKKYLFGHKKKFCEACAKGMCSG